MANEILLIGEIHPKIKDEYKIFESFYKTSEDYKNLFNEESDNLRRYVEAVPIVCSSERELIMRFKPQIVFMEVGIGRSDVRDIVDRINAEYCEFKYEGGDYRTSLIEQLIKKARSTSRMTGVIGNSHLKPAKKALIGEGIDVNCVIVGGIMDKDKKRNIGRAFGIIRTMLDYRDFYTHVK